MLSDPEEPAQQQAVDVSPLPNANPSTGAASFKTGHAIGGIVLLVSLSGLAIRVVPRFEGGTTKTDAVSVATPRPPIVLSTPTKVPAAQLFTNPFNTSAPAN